MLLIRQDSHLFLEGGVWRAAYKWIFITIVLLLTHKTVVSLDTATFGKLLLKAIGVLIPRELQHVSQSCQLEVLAKEVRPCLRRFSSLIYGQCLG